MAGNDRLRAIDMYSGVGGWSLGLKMAGIDVVASYERWGPANQTNFKNNRHQAQTVDIRSLSLADLPCDIDVVVGSPPCTQFSFSNRGGNGDISDGLEDISKFLSIVDHLRPAHWVMENVPRIAKIIRDEVKPGGRLHEFAHLNIDCRIVNMDAYGLPQRRRRCIAGNINFDLLEEYAPHTQGRTLGDVISALAAEPPRDPIYGFTVRRADLRDHVKEEHLSSEEARINRAAKLTHPVYNTMPFPDPQSRPVRTVTATCTRVSRESIVIEEAASSGLFRRLTVRERACLQGFPISFQFYGSSYGQKSQMVGNAIPPLFSFYVGQVILGTQADKLLSIDSKSAQHSPPTPLAEDAKPEKIGARYPWDRTFRFAVPSLRLKSGVRFELSNSFEFGHPGWEVRFIFGTSKSIHRLELALELLSRIQKFVPNHLKHAIDAELERLRSFIREADIAHMQDVWSHSAPGGTRPFMLVDALDESGALLSAILEPVKTVAREAVRSAINSPDSANGSKLAGVAKLERNAPTIFAGLLVGCVANVELHRHPGASVRTKPPNKKAG